MKEKQGRNDLCRCGSGQKFKKCCMRSSPSSQPVQPPKTAQETLQIKQRLFPMLQEFFKNQGTKWGDDLDDGEGGKYPIFEFYEDEFSFYSRNPQSNGFELDEWFMQLVMAIYGDELGDAAVKFLVQKGFAARGCYNNFSWTLA